MVYWLSIQLPMQGTQVQSLVAEDPACHGETNQPREPKQLSLCSGALEPQLPKPTHSRAQSHRDEKAMHHNQEQPPIATTRESPCAAKKTP